MSFRPSDSKREEFRTYLEKAGVLDVLTKALINLYEEPERPSDALEFVKNKLNDGPEVHEMKQEIEDLKRQVEELTIENNRLRLRELETPLATPGE